jgi:hypothetical protein
VPWVRFGDLPLTPIGEFVTRHASPGDARPPACGVCSSGLDVPPKPQGSEGAALAPSPLTGDSLQTCGGCGSEIVLYGCEGGGIELLE